METFRCFIAVDLPGEVKKGLSAVQQYLQAAGARIKWVEEANFHLTLKFLGEITQPQVTMMEEALNAIAGATGKSGFSIGGVGAFPNTNHPKIIWAGVRDSEKALVTLQQAIDGELAKLGFAREIKKFSPHLTLGRIKDTGPSPGFSELLQNVQIKEAVVAVNEFRLMRSKLISSGPEYSTIRSFELQEHF